MPGDFADTDDTMNHRSNDTDLGLKVNRVVPLWGIIVVCIGGLASVIQSYYNQLEQARNTVRLESSISSLTLKLDAIVSTQAAQNLKDAEHDLKIGYMNDQLANLRNRMTNVEAVLPRQYPTYTPPAVPQPYSYKDMPK